MVGQLCCSNDSAKKKKTLIYTLILTIKCPEENSIYIILIPIHKVIFILHILWNSFYCLTYRINRPNPMHLQDTVS